MVKNGKRSFVTVPEGQRLFGSLFCYDGYFPVSPRPVVVVVIYNSMDHIGKWFK
jgi:hypothetical protein